jgi:hypothetical protein
VDTAGEIPTSVQKLLHERIQSIEALEAILLMRSDPGRAWTNDELAAVLGINPTIARSAAQELLEKDLCVHDAPGPRRFRYSCPDQDTAEALDELARIYLERRMEILVFISRLAISRVRNEALRTFAQAFRISEKKKDG